jgi:predicted RNA-binding protein
MCEFTVFLNQEIVYRNIIYARTEENNVILRKVLGALKTVENSKITEVDVSSQRLVLSSTSR